MNEYLLGEDATRFSVVSFADDEMIRVLWSYNEAELYAGIDQMRARGGTSISDGIARARELFADDGRAGATKIMLLLSDGEQTVDAAPGRTPVQTAIDAAALAKADGITLFAWGFGGVSRDTLEQIATDPSKAFFANDLAGLSAHLAVLQAAVCNESPPSLPPPPPSAAPILPNNCQPIGNFFDGPNCGELWRTCSQTSAGAIASGDPHFDCRRAGFDAWAGTGCTGCAGGGCLSNPNINWNEFQCQNGDCVDIDCRRRRRLSEEEGAVNASSSSWADSECCSCQPLAEEMKIKREERQRRE